MEETRQWDLGGRESGTKDTDEVFAELLLRFYPIYYNTTGLGQLEAVGCAGGGGGF